MATTLQVSHLGKIFNTSLFEDVSLSVTTNSKIGLIGDNGSGKSTFLKMLEGLEVAEIGSLKWSAECKIGYLEQEITSDTFNVSGGEKKILRLTELFYGDYNVLLLDEPDNHLDLDHKLWFEEMVADFDGIIIVISHDRQFLTQAVNKIWQLEEKQIKEYPFGYEKFKVIYEGEMASRKHKWEDQERERLRLKEVVKTFQRRAQMSNAFVGLYKSSIKKYDKFVEAMIEKPPEAKKIALKLNLDKQPKKKTALSIKNLTKDYGDNLVLKGIDLHIFCGEKIAINAPNGSGKSTLLNILAGKLSQTSGEMTIGPGLKIGYYAQEHLDVLDENLTLVEELQKSKPIPHYEAIGYLRKFLFDKDQTTMPVKLLSGGQKSRLQLAKFLSTNPDILILDEPTNHLDLRTVLALENFLKDYEGTLILVSHDREMVNNVVTTTYLLKNGVLKAN